MRKVMLLAAMLAMVLVAAAPALAQDFEQENELGTVSAEVNQAIGTQVIQAVNQQNQFVNQNASVNAAGGAGGDVVDADGDGDITFEDRVFQGGGPGDRILDIDGDGIADATGGAGGAGGEVDVTQVAAQLGISVEAVNACLFNFATVTATRTATVKTVTPEAKKKVVWIEGKKFWVVAGKTVTATATATPTTTVKVVSGGGGGGTAAPATLPETGGASLLALGAGALLVGGGLLARRIAR